MSLHSEVYGAEFVDTDHIAQKTGVTFFSEGGLYGLGYNIPTEEQLTKMADIAGSVETLSELLQISDAGWYNFQTHARCCAGSVGCIWVKGSPSDTKMKYLVANKTKGVYSIVDSDDSKQGNQVRIVLEQ